MKDKYMYIQRERGGLEFKRIQVYIHISISVKRVYLEGEEERMYINVYCMYTHRKKARERERRESE